MDQPQREIYCLAGVVLSASCRELMYLLQPRKFQRYFLPGLSLSSYRLTSALTYWMAILYMQIQSMAVLWQHCIANVAHWCDWWGLQLNTVKTEPIVTAQSATDQQNCCRWHGNSAAGGLSPRPWRVPWQRSERADPCGQGDTDLLLSLLGRDVTAIVPEALVLTRLDYCNAVLCRTRPSHHCNASSTLLRDRCPTFGRGTKSRTLPIIELHWY